MLVSAVSMNGVIPAIKNFKQSNSNYASTAQTHDTFQKSGVSFGGGSWEQVSLATRDGVRKMTDHFSILKGRDPANASRIDKVREFCLGVQAKMQEFFETSIEFGWRADDPSSISDVMYSFGGERSSAGEISGWGEHLLDYIEKTEKLDGKSVEQLRRENEPVMALFKESVDAAASRELSFKNVAEIIFATKIHTGKSFSLSDAYNIFDGGIFNILAEKGVL